MSRLLYFPFSVTAIVLFTIVAAAWLGARPASRRARRFLFFVAIFYTLASTYVVPSLIGKALTRGYREFSADDIRGGPTAIVLLGGGGLTVYGWESRAGIVTTMSAARVIEAARVWHLIPDAIVVSSGGTPMHDQGQVIPEAVLMRALLLQLDVPMSRVALEDTSRDTHDEAVLITPMLRERHIQNLVLVTGDFHMRRSIGAFEKMGWHPIPAIAPDPYGQEPGFNPFWPGDAGLATTAEVVHELVGIPYYWIRGWWQG